MLKLQYNEWENEVAVLIEKYFQTMIVMDEQQEQLEQTKTVLELMQQKIKLQIAFVGQYDAGKSTIIFALTKNASIRIGQDVTTDKPQSFEWGQVLLIDTPGIMAGREDHDQMSLQYMDQADLLVYVITISGFDQLIGHNFRKLAFEENRIGKMLLVMNKASHEPIENMPNWIKAVLPVIDPLTPEEAGLTIIDAQDYIDGTAESDTVVGQELIAISGFERFQERLNDFIADKGLIGKLIAPLNYIQTSARDFVNRITASSDEVIKLQELLRRKAQLVQESRKRLDRAVQTDVSHLAADIIKKGHELVSFITPSVDGKELATKSEEISIEIDRLCQDTNNKVDECIQQEIDILLEGINELMNTGLAKELFNTLRVADGDFKVTIKDNRLGDFAKKSPERLIKIGGLLSTSGKSFKEWTMNANNVGQKGLKSITGSDAHKMILEIGHFFGKKFKPYEAQKIAMKVGNVAEKAVKIGKIMGAAQIVLAPAMAIFEEYQEGKYKDELNQARLDARNNFNEFSSSVKNNYMDGINRLFTSVHDVELKNIEDQMKTLRSKDKMADEIVVELQHLGDQAKALIARMNAK